MKSEISLFRTLLWAQIALAGLGVIVSIAMGDHLPEQLLSYNQMLDEKYSIADGVLCAVFAVAALIVLIGLFMLRPWAKNGYLAVLIVATAITFFDSPPVAAPGASVALYDLATMASGATLFMLYCTEFGRNWTSLRKRA